jgi:hypothetical protein
MATKQQVEALKAKIAELEAQKARIEELIAEAYGEKLAAEREISRNEKLTPAMRAALTRLATGAVLKSSSWSGPTRYWTEDENGDRHESIRKSVFQGLASREAIYKVEDDNWSVAKYRISDNGKSLVTSPVTSE